MRCARARVRRHKWRPDSRTQSTIGPKKMRAKKVPNAKRNYKLDAKARATRVK